MIMIDVPMPERCEVCMFGYWSNYYQTSGCTLTNGDQMFENFSRDYLERRSDKCPLNEFNANSNTIDTLDALDSSEKPNNSDASKVKQVEKYPYNCNWDE